MSKKLFVIYNPISGNNKSLKILPKVKSYLKDNDISFEIFSSNNNFKSIEIQSSEIKELTR